MKSLLLLILLVPFISPAQTVKPVISQDYLDLIKNTGPGAAYPDTANSISSSPVTSKQIYRGYKIKKIDIKDDRVVIRQARDHTVSISGSIKILAEIQKPNGVPALQNEYAQGRSMNGSLVWQGPETNELFSYGPSIRSLEYDGTLYRYDQNGRLVPAGTGNGTPAIAYQNNILQDPVRLSTSLVLQSKYKRNYQDFITASLKINKSKEGSVLPENKSTDQSISASVKVVTSAGIITAKLYSQFTGLTSSNQFGFLSRVYQNALLTPTSFSNKQGNISRSKQRSYSQLADNPYFLLDNKWNRFNESNDVMSVGFEKRGTPVHFSVTQSLAFADQFTAQVYKPGTAYFESGMINDRTKRDINFYVHANADRDFHYGNYNLNSTASLNYIMSADQADISYFHANQYHYNRIAHNLAAKFTTTYLIDHKEAGINLENKTYQSSTTAQADFFMPGVLAYLQFNNIFDSKITTRLTGSMSHYNSEVPLSQSFAQAFLLNYSTEDVFKFLPAVEAQSFEGLRPIRHREYSARAEIIYDYRLTLNAELFRHRVTDDVFPFISNNKIYPVNMATHRNDGVEIELKYNTYYKKNWSLSSGLSFTSYKSKVLKVTEGFDNMPVAGFSNIHKAIVKGQPLGVIRGKAFLRDINEHLLIGDDGFPLVDPALQVIGNPHPDFVMKLWNNLSVKKLFINLTWEWKKGGETWNGTEATLAYYGRSKSSANLRNTNDYVFDGVTLSGAVNTKPVSFYDPALAVTNNRWTRNGYGGVDEEYIQKTDYIRINNFSVAYQFASRKYVQHLLVSVYANNILVWTPYNGGDPTQPLCDQPASSGLDYFNLPSLKQFGFSATLQF